MDSDTRDQFLDKRIEQIRAGAREAIRREVAWLKEHNFPIWVSENGKVVDASENGEGKRTG